MSLHAYDDVIDVSAGPLTLPVHRFEAVASVVFHRCRVVVLGVFWARSGRSFIREPGVDAGLPEPVDVSWGGCDESDVDASGDRMLFIGLGEREVPPGREARRARGLLDLKLLEHRCEGAGGGREVGYAEGDVVEHSGLPIEELGQVPVERLCELKVGAVV